MSSSSLMMLRPHGHCAKCQQPLVVIGEYLRCRGCGGAVLLQALEVAVFLNRPLPPRDPLSPPGYIEGEEWVHSSSSLLECE